MGGLLSRLRQSNSDYEKILSDLDSNIRKAELKLSAINLRERRVMSQWLIYSVLIWLIYTAIFLLHLNDKYFRDPHPWMLSLAPVIMGLPAVLVGRSLINEWYKRAKTNEESYLNILRADQKLKVEELKKRTAYYSTTTLLERYDPASLRSNGPRMPGQDGPASGRQNGQPNPQHNMMDPGLRQRQGQGVANEQGNPGRPAGVSSGVQQPHNGQGPQNAPYGQRPPFNPNQPQLNNGRPYPHAPPTNERHWYDKIVDVIVGDEGPDTKYALVCKQCFAHNGLVLPQEIEDIQYVCPKCNFFNPSRRKLRMGAAGNQRPLTPEQTLLQAQLQPLPASRDPSPSPSAHRLPLPDHHRARDGPGLQEGHGPTPVLEIPSLGGRSESEGEFASNWNDSDAEGASHDEGDEESGTDDNQGYNVHSGDNSGPTSSEAKGSSGAKTKSTGKKKTKRA